MRYFLHIIADGCVVEDEIRYEELDAARAEAIRAAQDLMGNWLLEGKRIPPEASIRIFDENGGVADSILFEEAAFERTLPKQSRTAFG